MEKQQLVIVIATLSLASVAVLSGFSAYATETYSFRGVEFEEHSECAELFITFQTARAYDYMTLVPALMKFDAGCNGFTNP
jgi:hypothetical protein